MSKRLLAFCAFAALVLCGLSWAMSQLRELQSTVQAHEVRQ